MDVFYGLNEFVRTVELRSFKRAADALGLSRSAVSKSILKLETRLGIRGLNRTTRSVNPTAEGDLFYLRCKRILQDIQDRTDEVIAHRADAKGKLWVECFAAFGHFILMRAACVHGAVSGYHHRTQSGQPDCRHDAGKCGCLDSHGLAGRSEPGGPQDSAEKDGAGCRSVLSCDEGRAGIADRLVRARCPQVHLAGGRVLDWCLMLDELPCIVGPPVRMGSNDAHSLVDLAVAGKGIVLLMDFIVAPAIASGALVEILPDYALPAIPVHIGYQQNRYMSNKVRVFIYFICRWLEGEAQAGYPAACLPD